MTVRISFVALIVSCLLSCGKYTQESLAINNSIQTCGLVVRLSDRTEQAEKFRANGQTSKADFLIKKDRENNETAISDFSEHCSSIPVFFIYKKDTDRLLAGDRKNLFLKDDFSTYADDILGCNDFYFVDYGVIDLENEIERPNDWIVKDKELKALERPFPWRVNYPMDCIGRGKKTEAQCLCYKIERYIEKGDSKLE